jgi:hypothetical protein
MLAIIERFSKIKSGNWFFNSKFHFFDLPNVNVNLKRILVRLLVYRNKDKGWGKKIKKSYLR